MGARRLGLGTVQFGLDYGITNLGGRISDTEARRIIGLAAAEGVDTLDTAHLYGDSEAAIGEIGGAAPFRIVTKTPKFACSGSAQEAAAALLTALDVSLARLRRREVEALLLHDCDDLLGPHGAALWQAMESVRAKGLVRKIGVSVYDGDQIDWALAAYPIEIVQLPFNGLDRRLIEGGQIAALAAAGVEIHARSIFLQGLLLQDPAAIEPRFGPLRDAVADLHRWGAAHDLTAVEAALAVALNVSAIKRFIIGVTTAHEFEAIIAAAEKAEGMQSAGDFASSVALHPRYLNPARWAELA